MPSMPQQISAQTLKFQAQEAQIRVDHLTCLLAELRLQFKDGRIHLLLSTDVVKAVIIKLFAHLDRLSMQINREKQKFRKRKQEAAEWKHGHISLA